MTNSSDESNVSADRAADDPGSEFVVTDRPEANRFELHRNGDLVGFADYRVNGNIVMMPHVETLRAHRGQGYGARLMDGLLEIIRADGRRIQPICPFAAGHISDDPALHDLLA